MARDLVGPDSEAARSMGRRQQEEQEVCVVKLGTMAQGRGAHVTRDLYKRGRLGSAERIGPAPQLNTSEETFGLAKLMSALLSSNSCASSRCRKQIATLCRGDELASPPLATWPWSGLGILARCALKVHPCTVPNQQIHRAHGAAIV